MISPLFFALFVFQESSAPQQQLESIRSARQDEPSCAVDVRWRSSSLPQGVWNAQTVVTASLVSTIKTPEESCRPASIQIRANYYDQAGAFVCGGDNILTQRDANQTTHFEIRPLSTAYFFKWREVSGKEPGMSQRLICYDRTGREVRDPNSSSVLVKVFATVIPRRGGVAVAETSIPFPNMGVRQRPPSQTILPQRP
jgi:hypothetical protein